MALEYLGGKCVNCGSAEDLEIDHIKEVQHGGTDEKSNLRVLCKPCHKKRHDPLRRGFSVFRVNGQRIVVPSAIAGLPIGDPRLQSYLKERSE